MPHFKVLPKDLKYIGPALPSSHPRVNTNQPTWATLRERSGMAWGTSLLLLRNTCIFLILGRYPYFFHPIFKK